MSVWYGSVIFKYIGFNKADKLVMHVWVEYMLLCYG